MGSTISIRVSDELEASLDKEASLEGRPRSEIIRAAIEEHLRRQEKERFMAEMVAEARQAYSDPAIRQEAHEMAEEAIETGNEAMDTAEGREPGEPWPEETGEKWWR